MSGRVEVSRVPGSSGLKSGGVLEGLRLVSRSGGFADLYRGGSADEYAIKAFRDRGRRNEETEAAARDEYERLLEVADCPQIPTVRGMGTFHDGSVEGPAIIMDYIEGETLGSIKAKGLLTGRAGDPLSATHVAQTALEIARVLQWLDERVGKAHRDLSAKNVMMGKGSYDATGLREDVHIFLIDFGQAAEVGGTITPAGGDPRLATIPYGAPEVYAGKYYKLRNKPSADIWSLGALIVGMMAHGNYWPENLARFEKKETLSEDDLYQIADIKSKGIDLLGTLGRKKAQSKLEQTLHELVVDCTKFKPGDRPAASKIVERIENALGGGVRGKKPSMTTPVLNSGQIDPAISAYPEPKKGPVKSNPPDNKVNYSPQTKLVDVDLKHRQEERSGSECPLGRKAHSKQHDSTSSQSGATSQRGANRVARIALRVVITVIAMALASACWFNSDEIASRLFSAETSAYLANMYLHGHGGFGQNLTYALECYERAAEQGDKDSAYMAGYLHWIGPCTWQDWDKAKTFFDQADVDTAFLDGADNPDGAPETISFKVSNYTRNFLGDNSNTALALIKTNDGDVAYSTSLSDKFPTTDMSYTISYQYDYGLQYIMSNGYPCKSLVNNEGIDAYITQHAVWVYLNADDVAFDIRDETRTDEYDLLPIINDLASGATKQKGLSYYGMKRHAAELMGMKGGIATLKFNETEHRYETELIDAGPTDRAYKVSCSNESVLFVDEAGRERASYSVGEKFKVIVPENKYADEEYYGITLTALPDLDVARIYQSDEEGYEDIAVMSRKQRSVSSTVMAIAPSAPAKRPLAPLIVGTAAAILCFTAMGFAWKRLSK